MGLMSLAGCRIKTQLMSIFTTKKVYKFFSRQNRIQKDLPSCQLGLILKRAEDYHLSVQWTIYSATTFLESCRKVVQEKWFEKSGSRNLVRE